MALNGISELSTKEARQLAKLEIAEAKRNGKVVADDGTVSGSADPTKAYYRSTNVLDISELPTKYSGNTVVDNINSTGLVAGRPWSTSETPNLFSGLAIWYDAATAATINGGTYSNGTIVTTFTNRVTSTSPTMLSADGPTVQTGAGDTLNSYPVLRFTSSTGTSDNMRFSTDVFDDATGWTMVCLAKLSVTPGKNPAIFNITTSAGTGLSTVRYNSQSQFVLYAPTGTASVASNVDPDGTWKIITCRYDSTAAAASRFTFRWAKTNITVTNSGTVPSGSVPNTSARVETMNAWDGDFAEQVAFNRALTDDEIIALEDYLSSKWGV
jgi:hypothetical protein